MGIEPTFPGFGPVVLSQLNYGLIHKPEVVFTVHGRGLFADDDRGRSADFDGQVVPQDGDLQSGIRTRPGLASGRSLMASDLPLAWRITCNFRPIEIGVTNRICTGTNAFTGRDAAITS